MNRAQIKTFSKIRVGIFLPLLFIWALAGTVWSQEDGESYTKLHDRLMSIPGFNDHPILFIVGFDTSKSMSIQFDRAKQLTQTFLNRYASPGDSVYLFGFATTPVAVPGTDPPVTIPQEDPERTVVRINEALLNLGFSSEEGTLFTRGKLHALTQAAEHGPDRNVVVMLFADNYSELNLGLDERKRLEDREKSLRVQGETFPLLSQQVSPLWLTLYVNPFPDKTPLAGPRGQEKVDKPRLAWAARRIASQTLAFVEPESSKIEQLPVTVKVRFTGFSETEQATLTIDGEQSQSADFDNGLATFTVEDLKNGDRVFFVQAVLADGKVRTAERTFQVSLKSDGASESLPTPVTPTPEQAVPPSPESRGDFPWALILLLGGLAVGVYLMSLKPVGVQVIGPDSEKSFMLSKGANLRLGGKPATDADLVFSHDSLAKPILTVKNVSFGKVEIRPHDNLEDGSVEVETAEGHFASEQGEPLLTSATATWTSSRGRKLVFTLVKEEKSRPKSDTSERFGVGEEEGDDGTDWRS